MSTDTKYKYAVVRIPENSVVEFFTLLVSKGYSDVSFVASLAQCNLRDDPNDDQPTTSNSVKETVNDEDSNSENNKSSPPRRQSSGSQPQSVSSRPTLALVLLKLKISIHGLRLLRLLIRLQIYYQLNNGTEPKKPIFGFQASGVDFDLSNNEWHDNLKMSNGHSSTEKFHPYSSGSQKNDSPLQTRMKGWQREYIKEVIKNSHYPTEDELRDIELKCDLSRKQILRFIAKRLTNPNRKPRINHHDEKRKEQEERDSLGDQEDELQESDVSHLHHILSSLQETTA
ncbi:Protein CBR-NSY-7 [Caenorhabditis briggsae]|uniref:Protein CBR-NSY-7 n=1 Tax=Caenorhabditis briggsae TaxID=6238 RepID=A8WRF2_CAEBR|nr:Protein CBR-NSY-7 [Caenorhabditis briggsae]CAP23060.2 Protein CBR-NSY-7 [Caenorhabditis briggsae]